MKNIVNELVPQIETQLNQKLSKQKETVVSIILAWNDDHTAIHFWFESEWNDFSNPYGAPNLIISCSTFAKLIDAIATGKLKEIETDFNEEKVDFQNFGNLLMFSDPIKNKLASEVIDLANYSLIAITKQMCKRKNLTPSKSLLSFKITNLGKGNHATLTAVYSTYNQNKLFKAEFKNIESSKKTKGFVALSNEGIVFFRTNEYEKSKWEAVFNKESNVIPLLKELIINYGLENEYGDFKLLITHIIFGKLSLSLEYEMDENFNDNAITALLLDSIRENSNAIENETIAILTGPEKKFANRKEEDIHPNDKEIVQIAQKVPLDTKPLNFLPHLEKNLNTETPKYWNVTDFDTHKELGTSLLFFKRNEAIFNFTTQGLLVEFSIDKDKLVVKNQKQLIKPASCAFYFDQCLYIINYEKDLVQYNLEEDAEVTIAINRTNFESDIDHVFVNNEYMTLCSIDGLALYRRKDTSFEFLSLLTVGTTQILYTWAKQALIHNNYLYITAGNTGLVTYKLHETEKPKLIQVLSPECENPFCDKIDRVGSDLVLEMEGNHWLVDITAPEKPKSKALLVGGPKKEKMGPILLDNYLSFMDGNQPLLWEYSIKANGEVEVFCEHIAKNGEDVYFYYPKNYFLEYNTLLFSGNYGYSVLKREKASKIDYTSFKQIELKEDTLYHLMEQKLDTYFKMNKEISVGKLEIEPSKSGFKLSVYAPEYLIKSIGYSQNQLLSKDISWTDLDLKIEEPGYPYYAIHDKELKKTQYNLIKNLLLRFSQSSKSYWNSVVFYTYNGYNERSDRNAVIVEYVKEI